MADGAQDRPPKLIRAAALAGMDEGPTPPEVVEARLCKMWNTLPVAGGLLDQPYARFNRMSYALNVYEAFYSYSNSSMDGVKWMELNPGAWDIVSWVEMNILRNPDGIGEAYSI